MFLVPKVSHSYWPTEMSSIFWKSGETGSKSHREHRNSLMPRKSAVCNASGKSALFSSFIHGLAPNFHRVGELCQRPKLPIFMQICRKMNFLSNFYHNAANYQGIAAVCRATFLNILFSAHSALSWICPMRFNCAVQSEDGSIYTDQSWWT